MFGEKQIVGHTILRVSKNRIVVPQFTGVEIGEEITPMYDIKKKKLLLIKAQEYQEKQEKFEKAIKEMYEEGKITYHQLINFRRYFYGILSFYPEKVDNQRRLHLEQRIFRDLNLKNEVFAVGVDNHLEISPDEETYNMSKK